MFSLAWALIRGNLKYAITYILTLTIAIPTLFILITTTDTETRTIIHTINNNWRGTYDILVRPPGSQTPQEQNQNLLRTNFLTTTYGGITLEQLNTIRQIPEIQTAAPIAIIGQIPNTFVIDSEIGDRVSANTRSLIRGQTRVEYSGGFYRDADQGQLTYLTPNTIESPGGIAADSNDADLLIERDRNGAVQQFPSSLSSINSVQPPCDNVTIYGHTSQTAINVFNLLHGKVFSGSASFNAPLTWAAIDPEAENELLGIKSSVTAGTYLDNSANIRPLPGSESGFKFLQANHPDIQTLPALLSGEGFQVDAQTVHHYDLLSHQSAQKFFERGLNPEDLGEYCKETPVKSETILTPLSDFWKQKINEITNPQENPRLPDLEVIRTDTILRPHEVNYTVEPSAEGADSLRVLTVPPLLDGRPHEEIPIDGPMLEDSGFRVVDWVYGSVETKLSLIPTGIFNPTNLPSLTTGGTAATNLGTYQNPHITNTTTNTPYKPDLNPTGYTQPPPTIITALTPTIQKLQQTHPNLTQKPITAIRIKLKNIPNTPTPQTTKHIQQIAQQIHQKTNLQTDITTGASQTQQQITLPQTKNHHPQTNLNETWMQKNTTTIKQKHNTKNQILALITLITLTTTITTLTQTNKQNTKKQTQTLKNTGWTQKQTNKLNHTQNTTLALIATIPITIITLTTTHTLNLTLNPTTLLTTTLTTIPTTLLLTTLTTHITNHTKPKPKTTKPKPNPKPKTPTPLNLTTQTLKKHKTQHLTTLTTQTLTLLTITLTTWTHQQLNNTLTTTTLGQIIQTTTNKTNTITITTLTLLTIITTTINTWTHHQQNQQNTQTLKNIGWTKKQTNQTTHTPPNLTTLTATITTLTISTITTLTTTHQPPTPQTLTALLITTLTLLATNTITTHTHNKTQNTKPTTHQTHT